MEKSLRHGFIAIEGNIGAGKTTFCKMLEKDFDCKLILEQFTDNPFLPFFYNNPERYAFPVELFFMTERHKQMQEHLSQGELFSQTVVSDYFFVKTLLFAKSNLSDEEFRLFQRLYSVLNTSFRKPDVLVYLHRNVDQLMENIRGRGRKMEAEIKPEYLDKIQKAYFDFFKISSNIPILILHMENISFWDKPKIYGEMVKQLNQDLEPGIHHVEFPT